MNEQEKQQLRAIRETFQGGIDAINAMLSPAQNIEMQITGKSTLLSAHAVERYRERTGSRKGDVSVTNSIRAIVALGKEVFLRPELKLREMLYHSAKGRFFRYGALVAVVENGIVVTVLNFDNSKFSDTCNPAANSVNIC